MNFATHTTKNNNSDRLSAAQKIPGYSPDHQKKLIRLSAYVHTRIYPGGRLPRQKTKNQDQPGSAKTKTQNESNQINNQKIKMNQNIFLRMNQNESIPKNQNESNFSETKKQK